VHSLYTLTSYSSGCVTYVSVCLPLAATLTSPRREGIKFQIPERNSFPKRSSGKPARDILARNIYNCATFFAAQFFHFSGNVRSRQFTPSVFPSSFPLDRWLLQEYFSTFFEYLRSYLKFLASSCEWWYIAYMGRYSMHAHVAGGCWKCYRVFVATMENAVCGRSKNAAVPQICRGARARL
jgi:hypothetical protein